MLEIKQIYTVNKNFYYLEQLLMNSFPSCEYREQKEFRELTDHEKSFKNNIILKKNRPIGLITFWEFQSFIFVEHFAIDPLFRNLGYGGETLKILHKKKPKPLVLEVEPPITKTAERRVKFYKRIGLNFWNKKYFQPSYKTGEPAIQMYLMASQGLIKNKSHDQIKITIHNKVYHMGLETT